MGWGSLDLCFRKIVSCSIGVGAGQLAPEASGTGGEVGGASWARAVGMLLGTLTLSLALALRQKVLERAGSTRQGHWAPGCPCTIQWEEGARVEAEQRTKFS